MESKKISPNMRGLIYSAVVLTAVFLGLQVYLNSYRSWARGYDQFGLVSLNPYSAPSLNYWACGEVYRHFPDRSRAMGGCYDICEGLASKVRVPSKTYLEPDAKSRLVYKNVDKGTEAYEEVPELQPMFVSFEEHGNDMANACAVVLHGGEF